jgi:beta-glucanase (GH16 family)
MIAFFTMGCMSSVDDSAWVKNWQLTWEDNFDGSQGSPPNPEFWTHDIGGDGWGNEQLEYNTDRTENSVLRGDGFLEIIARKEIFEENEYTSARIKTEGLFSTTNSRVEARIKVPSGSGIWPAFWMLGDQFSEIGWPACGEIDIMEIQGESPNTVLGTVHGPGYSGGEGVGGSSIQIAPLSDDFHVYSIDNDPEHIVWSLDGKPYHTLSKGDLPPNSPWVFNESFFLILNIAVGGNFVSSPNESTEFPSKMYIDYVKVYERGL